MSTSSFDSVPPPLLGIETSTPHVDQITDEQGQLEFVDTFTLIEAESPLDVATDAIEPTAEREGIRGFLNRQKMKLCLGATTTSLAATALLDPMGNTKDKVMEAAPYVATGVVTSEVLWLGGAAMMLGAVGSKVGNPLKIKQRIPEISEKANDSKLFKAGFAVNIAGALGDFVVLSAGVMTKLPPHSWGTLSFTLIDLGVTLGVRKTMIDGIHANAEKQHESEVNEG